MINQRIDTFYGLNNMLNPASAEYREGMAYRSYRGRIDEHGVWAAQSALVGITSPPSELGSPHGSGNYLKYLAVDGTSRVVSMGLDTICDVGPNKKLYSTDGDTLKNAAGTVTAYTPPSAPTPVGTDGTGRQEIGTYYYMCTYYDNIYKRESLPSIVAAATNDIDRDSYDYNAVGTPTATDDKRVRLYRSKRTSAEDSVWNAANVFYFVTELTTGNSYNDRMSDREIGNVEYEGRGTDPVTAIGAAPDCIASFHNRMMYFYDNILYWSAAGQPQDVAVDYSVTIDSTAVACKPKLSIGVYAEAKYEITELDGHKVLAAFPMDGKLWVWTKDRMGFIEPTNRLEGYKFFLKWSGVGVTSDKVLALSPYGLFGADKQGVWLFDGRNTPKRLTDKAIDLHAGADTTFSNINFDNSFGVWVPKLNEYWWGVSGKILAYQADRRIFCGPYSYSKTGGCTVGSDAYLTGAVAPSMTTKEDVAQNMEFWFGQSVPKAIKDEVEVEICHSIAGGATAQLYQNAIASETGATSDTAITYTTSIGKVKGTKSGRMFMLKLTLGAYPLAAISYKYRILEPE